MWVGVGVFLAIVVGFGSFAMKDISYLNRTANDKVVALQTQNEDMVATIKARDKMINDLNAAAAKAEVKEAELQARLTALASENSRIVSITPTTASQLQMQLDQAKVDLNLARYNGEVAERKATWYENRLADLQKQYDDIVAKHNALFPLQGKVSMLEADKVDLQQQLAVAEAQARSLQAQIAALQAQLASSKISTNVDAIYEVQRLRAELRAALSRERWFASGWAREVGPNAVVVVDSPTDGRASLWTSPTGNDAGIRPLILPLGVEQIVPMTHFDLASKIVGPKG